MLYMHMLSHFCRPSAGSPRQGATTRSSACTSSAVSLKPWRSRSSFWYSGVRAEGRGDTPFSRRKRRDTWGVVVMGDEGYGLHAGYSGLPVLY